MSKLFKFSNLVVVVVIILNVWFTIEVLESFKIVGSEPTVLTGAFFSFTVGELWLLKDIKKIKIINNNQSNNQSDSQSNNQSNDET